MNTYLLKIKIDGGAAFQKTRVMSIRARGYEYAVDEAFEKLYNEFSGVVAFFNVVDWKRI